MILMKAFKSIRLTQAADSLIKSFCYILRGDFRVFFWVVFLAVSAQIVCVSAVHTPDIEFFLLKRCGSLLAGFYQASNEPLGTS